MTSRLSAVAVCLAVCLALSTRSAFAGTTERVSVSSSGEQGNERSAWCGGDWLVAISPDGRYAAFTSSASNLVTGDTNGCNDVLIRDLGARTTERVSVSDSGGQGNANSCGGIAVSADGRYVAFRSYASNLVPNDAAPYWADVFVRDRQLGTTELVNVSNSGEQANSDTVGPLGISADGRYVAFHSAADNLVPGDTNGTYDLFIRDRQMATTERISVSTSGEQGNGYTGYTASGLAMSGDGRFVAFSSEASNLVAGDTNGYPDVFVRDRLLMTVA